MKAFGDLKQVEIANLLNVKPSAITNYTKDRVPKAEILLRVWELTKCDLHWLLTGEHWRQAALPSPMPLENKEKMIVEDLAHTTGQTVDQVVHELLIEALENRGLKYLDEMTLNYGKLSNQDKVEISPLLREVQREIEERLEKAEE